MTRQRPCRFLAALIILFSAIPATHCSGGTSGGGSSATNGADDDGDTDTTARADGANLLDIGEDGSLQNPCWSPDGTRLVLTRWGGGYNEGPADILLFETDSSDVTTLVADGADNVNLPGSCWNEERGEIVFSSARDPHDELFVIDEDGSTGDEDQVTERDDFMAFEPSFSPDGSEVVFESHTVDTEDNGVIAKTATNGTGEVTDLTDSDDDCRQPNWAPAGGLIVYQCLEGGQWDLWTMATDGGNKTQITSGLSDKTDASFSPDGNTIVYSSNEGGLSYANLYTIPATGGSATRLTTFEGYDGAPSFSPDGTQVAFESYAGDPDGSAGTTLWVIATQAGSGDSGDDDGDGASASALLTDTQNWGYQLQNISPQALGDSRFDLIVVDYSADGSDDEAFSVAEITTMKSAGDTAKLVISYMSIGEAEDYRYYFDAGASYVDGENPDWPGNYKVRYWEADWQTIIDGYLDRIIAAGFDGVYLDIIDAYEYYGPGGDSGLERAGAANDMADFVIHISAYARAQDADFLVFPQNGAGIINDSAKQTEYFAAIDGIGAEDSFYFGDDDENNPLDEQTAVIANLDAFIDAGKVVLSVDYLTDSNMIDDYYERASAKSYIPYATIRALDALTLNTGHEP